MYHTFHIKTKIICVIFKLIERILMLFTIQTVFSFDYQCAFEGNYDVTMLIFFTFQKNFIN